MCIVIVIFVYVFKGHQKGQKPVELAPYKTAKKNAKMQNEIKENKTNSRHSLSHKGLQVSKQVTFSLLSNNLWVHLCHE